MEHAAPVERGNGLEKLTHQAERSRPGDHAFEDEVAERGRAQERHHEEDQRIARADQLRVPFLRPSRQEFLRLLAEVE